MGIPDHLTFLRRNLYAEETIVRTRHGKQTGFKFGKEYVKAVYFHFAYLIYAEYIMGNTGLNEAQAEIKIVGIILITSDMQMTPCLWQKAKKTERAS